MKVRGQLRSPGEKRPRFEVDLSPLSSAKVMNEWSYASIPPVPSRLAQGQVTILICNQVDNRPDCFRSTSLDRYRCTNMLTVRPYGSSCEHYIASMVGGEDECGVLVECY